MGHYLTVKSLKLTFVLDPLEVLALPLPETGKGVFQTEIHLEDKSMSLALSIKAARKAVAMVKDIGTDGCFVTVTGKLKLAETPALEDAVISAQPKAKKAEAPREPVAA